MPNAEEMRNDPEALEEGLRTLESLTDDELVSYVDDCKREAEEATRTERAEWQDYFDLWEGDRNYENKEEWQSKVVVEKPFNAVEQATAQIQRALLDSPEFLRADGRPSRAGFTPQFWEQYMHLAMEKAKFIPHYTDATQVGFITGIGSYLKARWNRWVAGGQACSFFTISNVLPWKIYRDPNSKPREQWSGMYLIHSDYVDLYRLKQSSVYENLDRIQPDTTSNENTREGRDRKRNPESYRSTYRHANLVDEFWGDILDKNGDLVATDILLAKIGRTIIRRPKPMPHESWDSNTGRKRWPFVAPVPFVHPHRFEGRGVIQQVVDLILTFENGLNISLDAMSWKVNNPSEFDKSLMDNPLDTKVVPGKGFTRKSPAGQGRAVQPIKYAEDISIREVLEFLEYIEKVYQNNSFINEFVVGLPGYRSDITKGEVQIKTAQSMAIFDRMGRSIELAGKDFSDLMYDMLIQYTDKATLNVVGSALPSELIGLLALAPMQVRQEAMRADLQLKFQGVSQAIHRADQLRRLMQLGVVAQNPMFMGRLENPSDLLRSMVDLLGYSDKIRVIDQPMMPMGPGGPGGSGGPEGGEPGGGPPGAGGYVNRNGNPRGVGEPPRLRDGQGDMMPTEDGLFAGTQGAG